MAGKALQHVIQKADARIDIGLACPVQVQGDGDLGLAVFRSTVAVRNELYLLWAFG